MCVNACVNEERVREVWRESVCVDVRERERERQRKEREKVKERERK